MPANAWFTDAGAHRLAVLTWLVVAHGRVTDLRVQKSFSAVLVVSEPSDEASDLGQVSLSRLRGERLALEPAWHARVMADEVVGHAFSHGYHPAPEGLPATTWRSGWPDPSRPHRRRSVMLRSPAGDCSRSIVSSCRASATILSLVRLTLIRAPPVGSDPMVSAQDQVSGTAPGSRGAMSVSRYSPGLIPPQDRRQAGSVER